MATQFDGAAVMNPDGSVTITPPPAAVGKTNWYFTFRPVGSSIWQSSYATLVAGAVHTRIQKPIMAIEWFMRGIDSTGVEFRSDVEILDLINSSTVVTVTEAHVPERMKIGEKCSGHAFSFQVQNGGIVNNSIANPARPLLAPFGTSMTHVQSGKFFETGTVAVTGDQGSHHHAFAFAAA